MGKKVTLHEEIRVILQREGNQWMTTSELAFRVNCRGRSRRYPGAIRRIVSCTMAMEMALFASRFGKL